VQLCTRIIGEIMESIMTWVVHYKQGLGIFVSFLSTVAIKRVSLVHSIYTLNDCFQHFFNHITYLRCDDQAYSGTLSRRNLKATLDDLRRL